MKYSVDRIEENIAILESLKDKEKKEIPITELPSNTKEGNILLYKNNMYIKDEILEQKRKKDLKNKFEMLRKKSG
ncbi:MAG: DUF3006 domain-containing protein [Candidatus Coprovivens sp.]